MTVSNYTLAHLADWPGHSPEVRRAARELQQWRRAGQMAERADAITTRAVEMVANGKASHETFRRAHALENRTRAYLLRTANRLCAPGKVVCKFDTIETR